MSRIYFLRFIVLHEQPRAPYNREDGTQPFRSTRIRDAIPDTFDPSKPRLGRRESEPHSSEITYLYDVLCTNFPDDRTMWDLHHYFKAEGIDIDIQFDISFFKDLQIPYTLSSYRAEKYNNRIPDMAVNVLSKSTWKTDIGETVDYCRLLEIPLYVVFPAYHVASSLYKPPFLRAYIFQPDATYDIHELKELSVNDEGQENLKAIIDTTDIVPFRLGLMEQEKQHEGNLPLYRMILLDKEKFKILPTEVEQAEQRAQKEKQRADNAEAKLRKLKKQLQEKEE